MKNLKIGVTIGLKSLKDSIWTNGIRLNTLILARMLQRSAENYQVFILNVFTPDDAPRSRSLRDIEIHPFAEKFREMDVLIMIGSTVDDPILRQFKASGKDKRVVSYRCGNDYVLLVQSILFNPESAKKPYTFETVIDEVWYVPQQHETNSGFYRTMQRTHALTVPFVWDEYFLKLGLEDIHLGYRTGTFKRDWPYQPRERKVLGTMEPNIDVVKFGLIPLMIAEESYRTETGRRFIEKVMLTNGEKLATHKHFMDIVKTFDLFRDQKITAESRFPSSFLLTQHLDVLICHQMLNPLNYLYLDAAYMGRPVLHNAPLVRDLGYFYEAADTQTGGEQLNRILTEHDKHIEEYRARNESVLWRYHGRNPALIATYDRLIERLYTGGNRGLRYNPATNLYDNG